MDVYLRRQRQVLTAEDPDSNTTTYTYNADGTMATMVNAASQTTTYNTYDSNKRLTKMTDPNGLMTQFTYDYRGRMLTKVVGSLTTTYTYDAAGNLTKVTAAGRQLSSPIPMTRRTA